MPEQFQRQIELNCSQKHAFRVFTEMADLWWPTSHRKDQTAKIYLEPIAGGKLQEIGNDGACWTIGEIISATPPNQLVFNWFPGSPNAPTRVEASFSVQNDKTIITITHSALSAAAIENWPSKVALFKKGWDNILPRLAKICSDTAMP